MNEWPCNVCVIIYGEAGGYQFGCPDRAAWLLTSTVKDGIELGCCDYHLRMIYRDDVLAGLWTVAPQILVALRN